MCVVLQVCTTDACCVTDMFAVTCVVLHVWCCMCCVTDCVLCVLCYRCITDIHFELHVVCCRHVCYMCCVTDCVVLQTCGVLQVLCGVL